MKRQDFSYRHLMGAGNPTPHEMRMNTAQKIEKVGNKFTPYWYRTPSDGQVQPAPEVPDGYEAVRYEDAGYHGGEYWSILPKGWTQEQAFEWYEEEGHINTLLNVGPLI